MTFNKKKKKKGATVIIGNFPLKENFDFHHEYLFIFHLLLIFPWKKYVK